MMMLWVVFIDDDAVVVFIDDDAVVVFIDDDAMVLWLLVRMKKVGC